MGAAILYVLLAALAAVGVYECRKGLKVRDHRSAGIWGLIAVIMVGVIIFSAVAPPEWLLPEN